MAMAWAAMVGMAAPVGWAFAHLRSRAVSQRTRSEIPAATRDPLFARAAGAGSPAVILLHGLVSTGNIFGAEYDCLANDSTLVVPDLLGFGRSIDESRREFAAANHLDSLDQLAAQVGLFDKEWIRLLAERACTISCHHRELAGWITTATKPNLPLSIAAYRDAMNHLVIETEWQAELTKLDKSGTSVELVWGSEDHVGDSRYADSITAELDHVKVTCVEGANHHLPMTHPRSCVQDLVSSP